MKTLLTLFVPMAVALNCAYGVITISSTNYALRTNVITDADLILAENTNRAPHMRTVTAPASNLFSNRTAYGAWSFNGPSNQFLGNVYSPSNISAGTITATNAGTNFLGDTEITTIGQNFKVHGSQNVSGTLNTGGFITTNNSSVGGSHTNHGESLLSRVAWKTILLLPSSQLTNYTLYFTNAHYIINATNKVDLAGTFDGNFQSDRSFETWVTVTNYSGSDQILRVFPAHHFLTAERLGVITNGYIARIRFSAWGVAFTAVECFHER